jgi:hypothetical protein
MQKENTREEGVGRDGIRREENQATCPAFRFFPARPTVSSRRRIPLSSSPHAALILRRLPGTTARTNGGLLILVSSPARSLVPCSLRCPTTDCMSLLSLFLPSVLCCSVFNHTGCYSVLQFFVFSVDNTMTSSEPGTKYATGQTFLTKMWCHAPYVVTHFVEG